VHRIAGITLGEDGATHQILEDIGLMRMLPGMVVINPCDFNQTKAATIAISKHVGPVYLRFGRPVVPNFTSPEQKFEIGKAVMLNEGKMFPFSAQDIWCGKLLRPAKRLPKKELKPKSSTFTPLNRWMKQPSYARQEKQDAW
jgi:transketolase